MNKTDKKITAYLAVYKGELEKGDIKIAYEMLVKYVMTLRAHLSETLSDKYTFGNVSPGYMDFTYFPFFDGFLRSEKLRFGVVLNHKKLRFELWLMGQNAEIQSKYWNLLKTAKWNENISAMPKYSVLEAVLVEDPDFDDLDSLSAEIEGKATCAAEEIVDYIAKLVV